jgi:hypothetical protein
MSTFRIPVAAPKILGLICALLFLALGTEARAQGAGRATFPTPEAAAEALAAAAAAKDKAAVVAIFGAGARDWLFTGDAVEDDQAMERFAAAYRKKRAFERKGDTALILVVGDGEFPFPFPLVRAGAGWAFDAEQGKEELLNRRIGRNELRAVSVLAALVAAQWEYAALPRDGSPAPQFARRIRSSPGRRDGLYWPTKEGEAESPLGPLMAEAARDGYASAVAGTARVPFHGYYYRILTEQGAAAPGGAQSYVVNGRMIGGFAAIAHPARYGASGVMTFIVGHDGVVHEKDLGPNTAGVAEAMRAFNPDETWRRVK